MKIEKYRVFDKKRGAWLHPTEFKLNGYGICWTLLDVDFRDLVLVLCTGLYDKNGKEIYESDYLGDWCVFWGSGKYILKNISTGDILDCDEKNTLQKEVTGNRFEHPREHEKVEAYL